MSTTISEGTIHVFTYKEGLLARLAHDLRLTVKKFAMTVSGRSVTAVFDARSLEVDGVVKGQRVDSRVLTNKDVRDIAKNIEDHVLLVRRHPEIKFEGRLVAAKNGELTVKGTLKLVGRAGPLQITLKPRGDRIEGHASVLQSRWGITPFSAMMGAIKIKNLVDVRLDLPRPPLPETEG